MARHETSYSRDRELVPTCWTAKVADLRVTVTKGHMLYKIESLDKLANEFERIGVQWDRAEHAANADLADLAALADRAAIHQVHFDTLDGVLKIGAESAGFSCATHIRPNGLRCA